MSNAKSAFGTQHVTKKPEATESGGIHGNPEYFEGREDIEVCCQRQMAFLNEKQLESAEISEFVRIFGQSIQDSSAFDELPRFWRMLALEFPTMALTHCLHGARRSHGVMNQQPKGAAHAGLLPPHVQAVTYPWSDLSAWLCILHVRSELDRVPSCG